MINYVVNFNNYSGSFEVLFDEYEIKGIGNLCKDKVSIIEMVVDQITIILVVFCIVFVINNDFINFRYLFRSTKIFYTVKNILDLVLIVLNLRKSKNCKNLFISINVSHMLFFIRDYITMILVLILVNLICNDVYYFDYFRVIIVVPSSINKRVYASN